MQVFAFKIALNSLLRSQVLLRDACWTKKKNKNMFTWDLELLKYRMFLLKSTVSDSKQT